MKRCDFCSEPDPQHSFDCTDYTAMAEADGVSVSVGRVLREWMACDECKKLIEADNWEGMMLRAMERISRPLGIEDHHAREILGQIQADFRKHRATTVTE